MKGIFKVSVTLPAPILQSVARRGKNRSRTIMRDLERLYLAYSNEVDEFPMTTGEALLLCHALHENLSEFLLHDKIWREVEGWAADWGYADKWHVDEPAFVARLKTLSKFSAQALQDAVDQYWLSPSKDAPEKKVARFFYIPEEEDETADEEDVAEENDMEDEDLREDWDKADSDEDDEDDD